MKRFTGMDMEVLSLLSGEQLRVTFYRVVIVISWKQANVVDTQTTDGIHAATVALCETLGNLTRMDDYETDEDVCMSQAYMTSAITSDDEPNEDTIVI